MLIDATPDQVWAAVRDFGEIHHRLAPGFVTDTRVDGGVRTVTFANGSVVRELIVTSTMRPGASPTPWSAAPWSPRTTTLPCRRSPARRTAASSSGSPM
ncbi:SRPBCC family protein [Streptomyces sp. ISL-36]|uniref:SRPBCC family protein n=1 Tax=Streptomyces sp. ISL-36 TaxID=2819182 RepID=UPI0035A83CE0